MKLAANRMMKILDQAKRLAPQSVTGALSPVQERTMQQAEALMAHPATSRLSQSALERPKTLFDHYVSVQPRPQGNLHDLLAEASNPTTSAARLGELASTPFREVVEAAAVNPNAGAELSRVHQLRPDLAEKNPATALMRMMDPLSSPPKMNEREMRDFKSDLRSKGNRRFHENLWNHVFTQRPLRIGNERVAARVAHKEMLGGRWPGRPGWNISTLSDPDSRALQALERSPRSQELESLRFPSEKRAFLAYGVPVGGEEEYLESPDKWHADYGIGLMGPHLTYRHKPSGLGVGVGLLAPISLNYQLNSDLRERWAAKHRDPKFKSEKEEKEKTAAPKTRLFAGLRVRIDRPKGYVQKGKGPDGKPWQRIYQCDYGYLAGTQGGDGDGLDVFLGPEEHGRAFLVIQRKDNGSFDEFKLMLGFPTAASAKQMYLAHIPAKYMGRMEEVSIALLQGLTGRPVDTERVEEKKAMALWSTFASGI